MVIRLISCLFVLSMSCNGFADMFGANDALRAAATIKAMRMLLEDLKVDGSTAEALRNHEERINKLISEANRIESKYNDLNEIVSSGRYRSGDLLDTLEEAHKAIQSVNDLYSLFASSGPEVVTSISSIENGQLLKRVIENQNRHMLLIEEQRLDEQIKKARSIERFRDFIRSQRSRMYE